LRERLGADVHAVSNVADVAGRVDGIVNATPVGMTKLPGMPIDPALISPRHWIADVVYFPLQTELIRHAYSQGCAVMPGGGMAVYQAVRAFALFSGCQPDQQAMADSFNAAIAG